LVTDDGLLANRAAPRISPMQDPGYIPAWGLRVAWFVYRGPASQVRFDPEQIKVYPDYKRNSPWTPGWAPPPLPPDHKFPVKVTFSAPGTFVVRLLAHDGGLQTTRDVTVIVTP
jgi:hypothetical protein